MKGVQCNHIGSIPVQNIWLLMAYAAEFSHLPNNVKSSFIDNSDKLPDLVIDLLCKSVEKRLRLGLSAGYVSRSAELTRVRGRINHLKSARKMSLSRGRIACEYTELSSDTTRNQFIRSALDRLSWFISDKELLRRSRSLVRVFDEFGVSKRIPTQSELSKDSLGRHDHQDKEMLELAKIALQLSLPSELQGGIQHYQPNKNEHWVRRLFEKAVAGFYRVVLSGSGAVVRTGTHMYWPYSKPTEGLIQILPNMRADIIIEDEKKLNRLIIDTKFNSITVAGWMRDETLRSSYLYQIYTYLRTQEAENEPMSHNASGMLLHPSVEESRCESCIIQNHKITFATVDLTQNSDSIKSHLLSLLKSGTNDLII